MAAPEGYTELGRIGFVDKGTYASGTTYRIGDVVYYNGSTWVALKNNLKGVTPVAGANWKYMARGFAAELLSAITAVDTKGLVGATGAQVGAQALIDAIADKVATKLLLKTDVINQIINDASKAASMAALFSVNEKVDKANSDLGDVNTALALKANSADLKYQIKELNGQDLVTLPQGRWCANNGTANNELGYWYVEVVEFDNRYRTVTAHPYEGAKKYYYYAKMIEGIWQGWEKYTSVL